MIGANHKCTVCEVGWSDVIGRRCWNCGSEGHIGKIGPAVIVPQVWRATSFQQHLLEREAPRIMMSADVAAQVRE